MLFGFRNHRVRPLVIYSKPLLSACHFGNFSSRRAARVCIQQRKMKNLFIILRSKLILNSTPGQTRAQLLFLDFQNSNFYVLMVHFESKGFTKI